MLLTSIAGGASEEQLLRSARKVWQRGKLHPFQRSPFSEGLSSFETETEEGGLFQKSTWQVIGWTICLSVMCGCGGGRAVMSLSPVLLSGVSEDEAVQGRAPGLLPDLCPLPAPQHGGSGHQGLLSGAGGGLHCAPRAPRTPIWSEDVQSIL